MRKRFYVQSHVQEFRKGQFVVCLDGTPLHTPSGHLLATDTEALAQAIAAEWEAQGDVIDPQTLLITQLLNSLIDRILPERNAITTALLAYVNTDLLCYRAPHPAALQALQATAWDPVLDSLRSRTNAPIQTTQTLEALVQTPALHKAIAREINALDNPAFTLLQAVTALSGSLFLALAFVRKDLTAADVFAASRIEEIYKAHIYGDEIDETRDTLCLRQDLEAAEKFLGLQNADTRILKPEG